MFKRRWRLFTPMYKLYQKSSEDKETIQFWIYIKSHFYSINERFSKFQCSCQYRKSQKRYIFTKSCIDFLTSSKNIKLNSKQIIYPLKQVDICDYTHRCIISSGLMFNDIIINLLSNKTEPTHGSFWWLFYKKKDNNIFMCRGSIHDCFWNKCTHESLYVVHPQ